MPPDRSRVWSTGQVWSVLGTLALALGVVWWALVALGKRAPDFSVPLCLAMVCGGAGLTVMLSGYMSGGLIGLPFAAALIGATLAGLVLAKPPEPTGVLATGAVMLMSLLVIGHFFGELTTASACLLWAAPLASWLPELAPRSISPTVRGWLRVAAVGVVVAWVLAGMGESLPADSSRRPAPNPALKTITTTLAIRRAQNQPRRNLPSLLFCKCAAPGVGGKP